MDDDEDVFDDPDFVLPETPDLNSSDSYESDAVDFGEIIENADDVDASFLPKEIQTHVYSGALNIYISKSSSGKKYTHEQAIIEAASLFSLVANDSSIDKFFRDITEKLNLDEDVMSVSRNNLSKKIEQK